jgi:hypothetical protein
MSLVPTLQTKLRHVDIHNHWLWQEHKEGRIKVEWVPTADQLADGFTKPLQGEKFKKWRESLGLADISLRLEEMKKKEELIKI